MNAISHTLEIRFDYFFGRLFGYSMNVCGVFFTSYKCFLCFKNVLTQKKIILHLFRFLFLFLFIRLFKCLWLYLCVWNRYLIRLNDQLAACKLFKSIPPIILGQIKDGYYRQRERLSRPIAVACEQCRQHQQQDDPTMYTNLVIWTPKYSNSVQPSRLSAQLQRSSFRGPFHPSDHYS